MPSQNLPCAACKIQRRKCTPECILAPYFPQDQTKKFETVHKVFGRSNVAKLLKEVPPSRRQEAVDALYFEADMRLKDPIFGIYRPISILQRQLAQLNEQIVAARKELALYGIFVPPSTQQIFSECLSVQPNEARNLPKPPNETIFELRQEMNEISRGKRINDMVPTTHQHVGFVDHGNQNMFFHDVGHDMNMLANGNYGGEYQMQPMEQGDDNLSSFETPMNAQQHINGGYVNQQNKDKSHFYM